MWAGRPGSLRERPWPTHTEARSMRTLLSSGNFVFTAGESSWEALERQAEQAMAASLGHAFPTIIRRPNNLQGLVARDPFAEFTLPPAGVVTFLRRSENPGVELPVAVA